MDPFPCARSLKAGFGELLTIIQAEAGEFASCKKLRTVNASFNYTFFPLLYKHYVAFNSSEIA